MKHRLAFADWSTSDAKWMKIWFNAELFIKSFTKYRIHGHYSYLVIEFIFPSLVYGGREESQICLPWSALSHLFHYYMKSLWFSSCIFGQFMKRTNQTDEMANYKRVYRSIIRAPDHSACAFIILCDFIHIVWLNLSPNKKPFHISSIFL